MSPRMLTALTVAVALLPEVLRVAEQERARRHAAHEAEKQRFHDAEQKQRDRDNQIRLEELKQKPKTWSTATSST